MHVRFGLQIVESVGNGERKQHISWFKDSLLYSTT